MNLSRSEMSRLIAEKISANKRDLERMWIDSKPVSHFFIDDLLPEDFCLDVANSFPDPDKLMLKSSLRERKRVSVNINEYAPCLADCLLAFQDQEVIEVIAEITGLKGLEADPTLYASGISVMSKGDFLNPHIDNSHDGDHVRYRALNLLFYVSPDWKLENGGNLELWDEKISQPHTVLSKFNRLVVMQTNRTSWHSVNKVLVDKSRRCVSNYYFAATAPGEKEYSNITSFAGRPEEILKRPLLKMDATVLNAVAKAFPQLTKMTKHRIKKP